MSYCRFAWDGSNVYVVLTDAGYTCYCKEHPVYDTPEEMIAHLGEHRRGGDFVPEYAIRSLWDDVPGPNEPVNSMPPKLVEASQIMSGVAERMYQRAVDRVYGDIGEALGKA
jgi:hypothetical protein